MDPFRPRDDPDFDNPYAPPRSSFVPAAVPRQDLLSIPCSIDAIVNATWSIYRDNLWTCTWLCWTVGLSSVGLYLLQRAIQAQIMSLGLVSIGLAVASVVFQTWLQIGLKLGLLSVARRQPVSAGVLVSGGPYLLPTIMAWIVFVVMLIPAVLLPIFVTSLVVAFVGNPAAAFFSIFIVTCVSFPVVVLYASASLHAVFLSDHGSALAAPGFAGAIVAAHPRASRNDHPGLLDLHGAHLRRAAHLLRRIGFYSSDGPVAAGRHLSLAGRPAATSGAHALTGGPSAALDLGRRSVTPSSSLRARELFEEFDDTWFVPVG